MLQSSRSLYDVEEIRRQSIMTQRPLRYVSDVYRTQRLLKESRPEDIDIGSSLRQRPTRLNYVDSRTNTALYGTSAYFGSGMQDQGEEINIDSGLRYGEHSIRTKIITENKFPEQGPVFETPVHIDFSNDLRFVSTRSDLRNEYKSMNCYKQRP